MIPLLNKKPDALGDAISIYAIYAIKIWAIEEKTVDGMVCVGVVLEL